MPNHFSHKELACKCGCGLQNTTDIQLSMLNNVRELVGVPMIVTSGSRCPEYNKKVGGVETSDHLTGQGTDVFCETSSMRFALIRSAIAIGFKRIGVAKDFIHLGSNNNNPRNVFWLY